MSKCLHIGSTETAKYRKEYIIMMDSVGRIFVTTDVFLKRSNRNVLVFTSHIPCDSLLEAHTLIV